MSVIKRVAFYRVDYTVNVYLIIHHINEFAVFLTAFLELQICYIAVVECKICILPETGIAGNLRCFNVINAIAFNTGNVGGKRRRNIQKHHTVCSYE